jgi:hypothetical protein
MACGGAGESAMNTLDFDFNMSFCFIFLKVSLLKGKPEYDLQLSKVLYMITFKGPIISIT